MASKPGTPAPFEPESSARRPSPADARERYGILELERLVKDDGRALILYRDAREQEP